MAKTPSQIIREAISESYYHDNPDLPPTDDALKAMHALKRELKNDPAARYVRGDDWGGIQKSDRGTGYMFLTRYFGDWKNPEDAEDEEDYDWQVPTEATRRRVQEIVQRVQARFPAVKLSWVNEGEKNYIGFYAE